MTNGVSLSELEKLRAELAQLKVSQQATQRSLEQGVYHAEQQTEPRLQPEAQNIIETSPNEQTVTDNSEQAEQQITAEQAQIDELKALLAKEIKDLPTVTTLAVFSLGVLMGRYLR